MSANENSNNQISQRSENDDEMGSGEGVNAGRWTDEEHDRFLDALKLHGKNWNLVHKHVGSRSSA